MVKLTRMLRGKETMILVNLSQITFCSSYKEFTRIHFALNQGETRSVESVLVIESLDEIFSLK